MPARRPSHDRAANAEARRLEEDRRREKNWKRWGPYLPERQWGTVREDYSADGDAWRSFPFDQAARRAYRWGEDGLLGLCDRQGRLCFSLALWNERDDRLKDRLFGLAGGEGNHGEDVKELYYYLDACPTHAYGQALYKYPQRAFPYQELREENARRGLDDPEFEILDTGIFAESRYWDVRLEHAKAGPNDLLLRIEARNCGPDPAPLHLLPKLWYRNTWIWGCEHEGCTLKPAIRQTGPATLSLEHETLGAFRFEADLRADGNPPAFLLADNETNTRVLYGVDGYTPHTKDAFERWLVHGEKGAVSPHNRGTMTAAHYPAREVGPGESVLLKLRLYAADEAPGEAFGAGFDETFAARIAETDAFYEGLAPAGASEDERRLQRQAYAGLLWTKQFYHYSVADWLRGDPDVAVPPPERREGRNAGWTHLFNRDVLSMPDKWEYPWYAAWDHAFHMVPFARIDPDFAKSQLILLLREWYLHPNGQLPAYEWAFDDVNPPVHAWACWKVYQTTRDKSGQGDTAFLERVFHKLLLNFTWWVNRKDPEGRNIFAGGFLGLDNIGLFDRSKPLPGGRQLLQADGTAWMAFYCAKMLVIALELAKSNKAYSDVASKFFEHFVGIADAMNHLGESGLWDEADGFYYDQIRDPDRPGSARVLKARSMVGLIALVSVETIDCETIEALPGFRKRMNWYLEHRKDLEKQISIMTSDPEGKRLLLAIPSEDRLRRLLGYVFEEDEFLSPRGLRSLSRHHRDHPFSLELDGRRYGIAYAPGDADSHLFGGNSNWRGPVWFPLNYLIVEALRVYERFYGDRLQLPFPARSGESLSLGACAERLGRRLVSLFLQDENGQRPCHGGEPAYRDDPRFRDLILFHEFFHGDNGKGLGASHQTGWTALAATLLEEGLSP